MRTPTVTVGDRVVDGRRAPRRGWGGVLRSRETAIRGMALIAAVLFCVLAWVAVYLGARVLLG